MYDTQSTSNDSCWMVPTYLHLWPTAFVFIPHPDPIISQQDLMFISLIRYSHPCFPYGKDLGMKGQWKEHQPIFFSIPQLIHNNNKLSPPPYLRSISRIHPECSNSSLQIGIIIYAHTAEILQTKRENICYIE